ncbi:18959_t:CDS:1, partial [Racocetra fulgida]
MNEIALYDSMMFDALSVRLRNVMQLHNSLVVYRSIRLKFKEH